MEPTPREVIEAAQRLYEGHFDLATIGWVEGTTVVLVFKWDSTGAIFATLKADLSDVESTKQIEKPRHP